MLRQMSRLVVKIRKSAGSKWVFAAIVAGLAASVTGYAKSAADHMFGQVDYAVCKLKSITMKPHDSLDFGVVIANLAGDVDDSNRNEIIQALTPYGVNIFLSCEKGPRDLITKNINTIEAVRRSSDEIIKNFNADILIWGSVNEGHLNLMFSDLDGYCSDESYELKSSDKGLMASFWSEFARSLINKSLRSIVADCNMGKLAKLDRPQLDALKTRLDWVLSRNFNLEEDTRFNIKFYRKWIELEILLRSGNAEYLMANLPSNASGQISDHDIALNIFSENFFAKKMNIRPLEDAASSEAYDRYIIAPEGSQERVALGFLAYWKIEEAHADDIQWIMKFRKNMRDLSVPRKNILLTDDDVDTIIYRYDMYNIEKSGIKVEEELITDLFDLQNIFESSKSKKSIFFDSEAWVSYRISEANLSLAVLRKSEPLCDEAITRLDHLDSPHQSLFKPSDKDIDELRQKIVEAKAALQVHTP